MRTYTHTRPARPGRLSPYAFPRELLTRVPARGQRVVTGWSAAEVVTSATKTYTSAVLPMIVTRVVEEATCRVVASYPHDADWLALMGLDHTGVHARVLKHVVDGDLPAQAATRGETS